MEIENGIRMERKARAVVRRTVISILGKKRVYSMEQFIIN